MTLHWSSPLSPETPYGVKRRLWALAFVVSFIVILLVFAAGGRGGGMSGEVTEDGPVTRTIVQLGDPEAAPIVEPEPAPPAPSEPEPEPEPTKLAERAEDAPEPVETEPETEPQPVETVFADAVRGEEDGEVTEEAPSEGDVTAPGDGAAGAAALPLLYVEISTRRYLERVRYPPRAEKRNIEGLGLLKVTVAREGTVIDWEIVESSGSPILDAEIRRVARQVRKLDPLPSDYPYDTATFIVPFNFILQ